VLGEHLAGLGVEHDEADEVRGEPVRDREIDDALRGSGRTEDEERETEGEREDPSGGGADAGASIGYADPRPMFDRIFVILGSLAAARPHQRADERLTRLFETLQRAPSADVAETIEGEIWQVWCASSDETGRRLMQEGIQALAGGRIEPAEITFGRLIAHDSDFAEAWNKRATARFLLDDHKGSVADIEETLVREPRHFGALAGLGQIMMAESEWVGAATALEAALRVNPHLKNVRTALETLKRRIKRSLH
jgi:tetratricopeptide (TPR) repeat protein